MFGNPASAPCVSETHVRDAEVALFRRRTAGEDIGPRTAALEQPFALRGEFFFEASCPIRIEQHAHFAKRCGQEN